MNIYGVTKGFKPEKEISDSLDLHISHHWLRKKKWNCWCITNEKCLFSIIISNLDYAGLVKAYFYNFLTGKYVEKKVIIPFGKGCRMPDGVNESIFFNHRKLQAHLIYDKGITHIIVKCSDFGCEQLEADLKIRNPKDDEALNVLVPLSKKCYQFTSKLQCLPAEGIVQVGRELYPFEYTSTFACLDFGRGIWPHKFNWSLAAGSGIMNGKTVGFNLETKGTNGTGITENALLINHKLIKLGEDIKFLYDSDYLMKPWKIRTCATDRVNLEFVPVYEHITKTDFFIIKYEVHELFGSFYGVIEDENHQKISIENLKGCSEYYFGKW